jgi:hypothetical protein
MTVTVQINGTTLNPQPSETAWEESVTGGKLDGTDALGAYSVLTLRAPVESGGTANWNWSDFENQVLTSITVPDRLETMRGTGTTYSSGVVSKKITKTNAPPGGLVRGVEMRVLVVT